jgi:prevent-host-death family protein
MTYNIHEAKTHLSRLLEKVQNGEKVIIAKSGSPLAELIPIKNTPSKRILGLAKGQVVIKPDFDELPDEIIDGFYK